MHVTEHCTLAGTHIGALEFPSALLPSRLSAYVLPRLYMHVLVSPTSLTVAYASAATTLWRGDVPTVVIIPSAHVHCAALFGLLIDLP